MKTRRIIVEVICFVLLMNWFYEGIYKVAYWGSFSFYIKHAPLLKPVWQVLAYVIPVGEIGLALLFLFPKKRMIALYLSIGGFLVFVFWIMSTYLFTSRLFWPYHALWQNPTWMQKMLISLGLGWMAFIVIVLSTPGMLEKLSSSKVIRHTPININR
jgi:hypothetical protein